MPNMHAVYCIIRFISNLSHSSMKNDPLEHMAANEDGSRGCSFCGGLGHSIVDCPKIDKDARRVAGGHKDAIASGDGYGGDW
jgi:ATP-dependent RNA helicase DDX41